MPAIADNDALDRQLLAKSSSEGKWIAHLVAAAFFMENLDATIISTVIPAMANGFRVAPSSLSVGISAYLLALAAFIPVSGWVADRLGPRQVFTGAILIFTVASVACGLADSLALFVCARVVQGIGGALMVPVGRMVVLRSTPKAGLVKAIATITWPGLAAPILAPPLGAWIATNWGWQWIFFINVPLGLIAIFFALRWIRGEASSRRPFDWVGFLFSGMGLAAMMFGVELMTQPEIDWSIALAAEMVGAGSLAFSIWHMRRTLHPLVDLGVFKVQTFRASAIGGSFSRAAIGGAPFLLPLMFQLAFGLSMVTSGLLLLALFAGNLCMKPFTAAVLRHLGFRNTLLINGLLVVAGFLVCMILTPSTPLYLIAVVMVFGGMSRSMQFTAVGTLAFCDTSASQSAGASTLFSMLQQLSTGVGIAFCAIALRIAQSVTGSSGSLGMNDFRIAIFLVAALMAISLIDAWALPKDAGAMVSGHT